MGGAFYEINSRVQLLPGFSVIINQIVITILISARQ